MVPLQIHQVDFIVLQQKINTKNKKGQNIHLE